MGQIMAVNLLTSTVIILIQNRFGATCLVICEVVQVMKCKLINETKNHNHFRPVTI